LLDSIKSSFEIVIFASSHSAIQLLSAETPTTSTVSFADVPSKTPVLSMKIISQICFNALVIVICRFSLPTPCVSATVQQFAANLSLRTTRAIARRLLRNNTSTNQWSDDRFDPNQPDHIWSKNRSILMNRIEAVRSRRTRLTADAIKRAQNDRSQFLLTPSEIAKLSAEQQSHLRLLQWNMTRSYVQSIQDQLLQSDLIKRKKSLEILESVIKHGQQGKPNTQNSTAANQFALISRKPLFDEKNRTFEMSPQSGFSLDKLILQNLVLCRIGDEAKAGPFRSLDQLMPKLSLGDIVEIRRSGYSHFTVNVGSGMVLQLQNPSFRNITPRTVFDDYSSTTLVTPIRDVVGSWPCRINNKQKFKFPVQIDLIKQRIRVALESNGTQPYNVFANNCEHFATFIRFGFGFSEQVSTLIGVAKDVGQSLSQLLFQAQIL
jgi:hypothetical protein